HAGNIENTNLINGDTYNDNVTYGQSIDDLIKSSDTNVADFDANHFLPQETNKNWFETDFSLARVNVDHDTLINTDRYIIGTNTVGNSRKNSSYDPRGNGFPNPKMVVSPWLQSTY